MKKLITECISARVASIILLLALLVAVTIEDTWWQNRWASASATEVVPTKQFVRADAKAREAQSPPNTTYLGVLGLGLVAIQAWIAYRQTALIDKQATIAHQSYIATHRARLHAKRFRLASMRSGEPIDIHFGTTNSGATDAEITGRYVQIAILQAPGAIFGLPILPITPARGDRGKIKGGETLHHIHVDSGPVHEDDITAVNAGRRFLHVIGVITYTDDNGHPRETGFFRWYDIELRRFRKVDDPDFEYES